MMEKVITRFLPSSYAPNEEDYKLKIITESR
jgi:hypothetical protein